MGGNGWYEPGRTAVILLDTHVLLWLRIGDRRLGRRTREAVEPSWTAQAVAVSAISFWEVAMLHDKGRLTLLQDIGAWRRTLLDDGLVEITVDGEIGTHAAGLASLPGDPADRLIVATALLGGHQLVTADRRILGWAGQLRRLDARE